MKIVIASDQAGFPLRDTMLRWIADNGHDVDNRCTDGTEAVHYPYLCTAVGEEVSAGRADRGLILGGSGLGEAMAANKVPGVRAALCNCLLTARMSRTNNDANVLILGSKIIAPSLAEEIADVWFSTAFDGGRHVPRIEQMAMMDRREPLP